MMQRPLRMWRQSGGAEGDGKGGDGGSGGGGDGEGEGGGKEGGGVDGGGRSGGGEGSGGEGSGGEGGGGEGGGQGGGGEGGGGKGGGATARAVGRAAAARLARRSQATAAAGRQWRRWRNCCRATPPSPPCAGAERCGISTASAAAPQWSSAANDDSAISTGSAAAACAAAMTASLIALTGWTLGRRHPHFASSHRGRLLPEFLTSRRPPCARSVVHSKRTADLARFASVASNGCCLMSPAQKADICSARGPLHVSSRSGPGWSHHGGCAGRVRADVWYVSLVMRAVRGRPRGCGTQCSHRHGNAWIKKGHAYANRHH